MSKVFTGCRAKFQLDGVTVGYAQGVTLRESIQYEPINVMDNIQTKEHAPIGYECSMTADIVRLVGASIKSAGWFPKQGTSVQEHLNNIISSGALTATILDNNTNQIIRNVEGVRIQEANMNIVARGVVAENVSMVAIRARDESDVTPS